MIQIKLNSSIFIFPSTVASRFQADGSSYHVTRWIRVTRKASLAAGKGVPVKSGCIAYGVLLIREQLGIADEDGSEQIWRTPICNTFWGCVSFWKSHCLIFL